MRVAAAVAPAVAVDVGHEGAAATVAAVAGGATGAGGAADADDSSVGAICVNSRLGVITPP